VTVTVPGFAVLSSDSSADLDAEQWATAAAARYAKLKGQPQQPKPITSSQRRARKRDEERYGREDQEQAERAAKELGDKLYSSRAISVFVPSLAVNVTVTRPRSSYCRPTRKSSRNGPPSRS
jgi:hypothetical protein